MITVTWSVDELRAWAALCDEPDFPGLGTDDELDAPTREAVSVAAVRGLLARGHLQLERGELQICAPWAKLLSVIFEPELLVTVETSTDAGELLRRVLIHTDHDVTIRQVTEDIGVRSFRAFDTTALAFTIADEIGTVRTDLTGTAVPPDDAMHITVTTAWDDGAGPLEHEVRLAHAEGTGTWVRDGDNWREINLHGLDETIIAALPNVETDEHILTGDETVVGVS
jgi:hypothetical protein